MKIMLNYTLCICQNIKGMLIKIIQMIISKLSLLLITLDIEFVDIGKEIFEKAEDFRILFPFGESGHYNEEGYSRIAKKLNKLIEN